MFKSLFSFINGKILDAILESLFAGDKNLPQMALQSQQIMAQVQSARQMLDQMDNIRNTYGITYGQARRLLMLANKLDISESTIFTYITHFGKQGGYRKFITALENVAKYAKDILPKKDSKTSPTQHLKYPLYKKALASLPQNLGKLVDELHKKYHYGILAMHLQQTQPLEKEVLKNEKALRTNLYLLEKYMEQAEQNRSSYFLQNFSNEKLDEEHLDLAAKQDAKISEQVFQNAEWKLKAGTALQKGADKSARKLNHEIVKTTITTNPSIHFGIPSPQPKILEKKIVQDKINKGIDKTKKGSNQELMPNSNLRKPTAPEVCSLSDETLEERAIRMNKDIPRSVIKLIEDKNKDTHNSVIKLMENTKKDNQSYAMKLMAEYSDIFNKKLSDSDKKAKETWDVYLNKQSELLSHDRFQRAVMNTKYASRSHSIVDPNIKPIDLSSFV